MSRQKSDRRPLVVTTNVGGRGERVLACCDEAHSGGVNPGVSLAEARAVLSRSGCQQEGLEVVVADEDADRRLLADEARWAWRFTPQVSVPLVAARGRSRGRDPRECPTSLLLNVTGCGHLFGGERRLAQAMKEGWLERGGHVRIAVAGSPGTAWAIAHAAQWVGLPWDPLVVPPGSDSAWMPRLPVRALALEPGVLRTLGELNVLKVEQLLALPVAEVKRRFGAETVWRVDRAMGQWEEILEYLPMPSPVVASREMECPVNCGEWLEEILRELVQEVVGELGRRGELLRQVECRIRSETPGGESEWTEWVIGLVEPSCELSHLWNLVRLQFERRQWPARVLGLEVVGKGLVSPACSQQRLFDAGEEDSGGAERLQRGLGRLVETLTSRLGKEGVSRARLCEGVVPEKSAVLEPMDEGFSQEAVVEGPSGIGPARRPLRLFERAIAVMTVVAGGTPVRFFWKGRGCRVIRCWGPERIETDWWTDRAVTRDYYRVETDTGEWYWLFRQRQDDEWFVHGVFG